MQSGGSSAGPAAIGALVIELDACCKKIEWIRTDRPLIHSPLGRCAVARWLLPSARIPRCDTAGAFHPETWCTCRAAIPRLSPRTGC